MFKNWHCIIEFIKVAIFQNSSLNRQIYPLLKLLPFTMIHSWKEIRLWFPKLGIFILQSLQEVIFRHPYMRPHQGRGGGLPITQSCRFFSIFTHSRNQWKIGIFMQKTLKLGEKHAFHKITHVFEWFHEITHIFRRFHASRTQVDSRNHAEIKSFSRFHATKKGVSRNHATLWGASWKT